MVYGVFPLYVVFDNFRDENLEKLELSEYTVNPDQPKTGPQDFELLKLLGKGGYGKVSLILLQFAKHDQMWNLMWRLSDFLEVGIMHGIVLNG